LKQKFENIMMTTADWKYFVFADSLLPFGTIGEALSHCTHLQIACAYSQNKICKKCNLPNIDK